MVLYTCDICLTTFDKKSTFIYHTKNKKKPCHPKKEKIFCTQIETDKNIGRNFGVIGGVINGVNLDENILTHINNKKFACRFCCKEYTRQDNLKRHITEERCKVLELQKQQKENIFINLVKEDEIKNSINDKLDNMINSKNKKNQILFLINEMKEMKKTFETQLVIHKNQLKKEFDLKLKTKLHEEKNKIIGDKLLELEKEFETKLNTRLEQEKNKIIGDKLLELEKNNIELQKLNFKLRNKMDKIVNKNKVKINTNSNNTNSNNTQTNTIINNNQQIKLVNFGSEDLNKISHNVFIDTIRSQGFGLYNKAVEGIHFNKEYPENQNIYISDFNRDKVMIYKDEKWFLDNWDNIYNELLEKIIRFGYDKNDFLHDCGYKVGNIRFNKQMIKNGMRWYKLLDDDASDIEYFEMDVEDRPQINEETYNDYLEMYNFRKKHQKKQTEDDLRCKMKLNIYNKRDIPICNYKQISNIDMNKLL
jgi:hypothetical protein